MGHGHHAGHNHDHSHEVSRKLGVATGATAAFVVLQLAFGLASGSLALIGDAFHNFTDSLALLIAWVAVRLERRPPTEAKSYGYQRAGIIAAFVNAGVLVAVTIFLLIEAVERLRTPSPVNSTAMLGVAAAGIVLNLGITLSLRRERREDVNIRSAVVHMLADAISSVGIIVAALLIRATGSPQWDPAVTFVIGALILWSSWGILREAVNLLLEGTPSGIDPASVLESLMKLDGVEDVHHLHIWALGPSNPALSCHVILGDVPLRTTATLLERITDVLKLEHRIVHTTIQFESAACPTDDVNCVPARPEH